MAERAPFGEIHIQDNDQPGVRAREMTSSESIKAVLEVTCCLNLCCQNVTFDEIKECRKVFWTMKVYDQRKFIVHSLRQCHSGRFVVNGRPVCETGWRHLHGIKKRRFHEIKQRPYLQKSTVLPRQPGVATVYAMGWMENYSKMFGDRMPDRPYIHLPHCLSKLTVFEIYTADMQSSGRSTVSQSHFYDTWEKHFSFIKISKLKGNHASCTQCTRIKSALMLKLAKPDRTAILEKMTIHLDLSRKCREKYYKHQRKAAAEPNKYISLIVDNMDQAKTRLPRFSVQSKADAHLQQIQVHVTGVKIHDASNGLPFLLTWTDALAPDANVTTNAITHALHKYSQDHQETLPPVMYLQMDNAGKDNKNVFVLLFLAWLVKNNIFKKIKVGFLMVGHTHEDVDQMFSCVAKHLHRQETPTLPHLHQALKQTVNKNVCVHHMDAVHDYRQDVLGRKGAISGISGPHHFILKMSGQDVVLGFKDWPDSGTQYEIITHLVPESIGNTVGNINPKVVQQVNEMAVGVEKWKEAGRLASVDIEWWRTWLADMLQSKPASTMHASSLPRQPPPEASNRKQNDLLDAIEKGATKEKKKSLIKIKKK